MRGQVLCGSCLGEVAPWWGGARRLRRTSIQVVSGMSELPRARSVGYSHALVGVRVSADCSIYEHECERVEDAWACVCSNWMDAGLGLRGGVDSLRRPYRDLHFVSVVSLLRL